MADSFFTSWDLWEKMTFVLALAIIAVFGIGFCKLVWRNRLVKKQEQADEEKRIRIQELRISGQMAESRKSHDIPFGVRAIQSGIQVDGIWISKDSVAIPAILKFSHLRGNSSGFATDSDATVRTPLDVSQVSAQSISSRGRALFKDNASGRSSVDEASCTEAVKAFETQGLLGYRSSYKPRRSSHLRYDSQGETQYDPVTFEQLEGKPILDNNGHTNLPPGTQQTYNEGDSSSGASPDKKCFSGSDTDATLPNSIQVQSLSPRHSFLVQYSNRNGSLPASTNECLSRPPRVSLAPPSSKGDYVVVPLESPEHEKSDLFASPLASPVEATSAYRPLNDQVFGELTAPKESQVPLLSQPRCPLPFIPGELHVNKTVRKVNSGFEVLPAGTFGIPAEFKGKGVNRDDRWSQDYDNGERRHSKLQKKTRTSMSFRRPSGTLESP